MATDSLNLLSLVAIYRTVASSPKLERDIRFPPGERVAVFQPGRFTGGGVTADSTDLAADQVAVLLENGNVWHYDVDCVQIVKSSRNR